MHRTCRTSLVQCATAAANFSIGRVLEGMDLFDENEERRASFTTRSLRVDIFDHGTLTNQSSLVQLPKSRASSSRIPTRLKLDGSAENNNRNILHA